MIIDFHNHYYPPAYLDAIRSGGSAFRITDDDAGNPVGTVAGETDAALVCRPAYAGPSGAGRAAGISCLGQNLRR